MINHNIRAIKLKNDEPTDYSKIYDYIYGGFAKEKKYDITNKYKTELMGIILKEIPELESRAVSYMIRFQFNTISASKASKMTTKELNKLYDLAIKHMYSPKLIGIAVNNYYKIEEESPEYLTKETFGGKKYIVTALNKAGIYTKGQLYKHLNNGWRFLWTIPGCGDVAKMNILVAIDKWEGRGRKFL